MDTRMTEEQVRATGLIALQQRLGQVGMVRFLQYYETGQGNYSVDRHQWLGDASAREIAQRIEQARRASHLS